MKKLIKQLSIAVLALMLAPKAGAQSLETVREQMVKDWERAKEYTTEYLNTMPADKYSFRPNDSIRSFAEQMLHIATANVFLTSQVTPGKFPDGINFELEKRATAQNKDSVVSYVMASYDYAINAVKNSDMKKWWEEVTLFNRFKSTKFALLNKAFEHQTHHRGQTTIYIRLQEIKPPQEKLF